MSRIVCQSMILGILLNSVAFDPFRPFELCAAATAAKSAENDSTSAAAGRAHGQYPSQHSQPATHRQDSPLYPTIAHTSAAVPAAPR